MYYRHFGLDGPPFRFSPNAAALYLSATHRECLAALEWGLLHDQCGFMLLTGETGTGKTTLLNEVLARRIPSLHLACVTNPRLSFEEILRVVLPQLGVKTNERGRLELIQELERAVANQPDGHRTAIVIDEAQDLSDDTLEDFRLLANRIGSQDRDLQIVLMGHPEMLDRLSAHNLRQLRERISTNVTLLPLSRPESIAYVYCRLESQNGTPRLFDAKALRLLVDAAAGIPRRLNVLCHNALVLAYSKNAGTVTRSIAREVIEDNASIIRPSQDLKRAFALPRVVAPAILSRKILIPAAGACAAVAVIGMGAVFLPAAHDLAGPLTHSISPVAAAAAPTHPEAPSEQVAEDKSVAASLGYTSIIANASAATIPSQPRPAPRHSTIHIQAGDTFHDLAAKYLGSKDRTPDLIKANPQIDDPNVLYVGETVYLPSTHNNDQARAVR
jgi:general secretion pathway protein A